MGVVLAVPWGTMLLGDLGAEIIRVESTQVFPNQTRGLMARPPQSFVQSLAPIAGGYPQRDPGKRPWNRFPWFNTTARNKLGMTVDLRRESGLEVFRRLVKISDGIIENNTPGSLERLGITYEWLHDVNPKIIFVRASSFGQTGPYRGYRALGMQIEAFAGHDLLRTYRDRDPSANTWMVPSDAAGGLGAILAFLMALRHRQETGEGQLVDLSLVENFANIIGEQIMDYTMNGRVAASLGNRDTSAVQGVYRCRGEDRWMAVTIANDDDWRGFCKAADHSEWIDDPRFATATARYANHEEVDLLIESWTANLEHREAAALLQGFGVPAGPVLDDADAYQDPQLLDRQFFVRVVHADAGTHDYPGPIWKLSATPLTVRHPPVLLGEHNEHVYKDLLGYSDDEYQALSQEGHIGTDYADHIP
jgi:crotonobetainyl-CoA:carnitine CoA-transferase CaiB-like acyl-CoA transferase